MKINGEPITDQTLRKMRGLFASGVTVVTTVHEGKLRGVTVSAFASVSLNPPLVLICIANESESKDWIAESGVFAVNILSDEQEFLVGTLRRPRADRECALRRRAVSHGDHGFTDLGRSRSRGMTAAWKPRTTAAITRSSSGAWRRWGSGQRESAVGVLCESVCGIERLAAFAPPSQPGPITPPAVEEARREMADDNDQKRCNKHPQ